LKSYTLERALSLLSEKHVEMKLNEGFKKQLTQLEFKLYGVVSYDFFDIGVRTRRATQKFDHWVQSCLGVQTNKLFIFNSYLCSERSSFIFLLLETQQTPKNEKTNSEKHSLQ
jgi:hypothetical protein